MKRLQPRYLLLHQKARGKPDKKVKIRWARVDKLRHQESLWREDLQSGGNPRTKTPTSYEPKELATVSKIEAYSGDPYQSRASEATCLWIVFSAAGILMSLPLSSSRKKVLNCAWVSGRETKNREKHRREGHEREKKNRRTEFCVSWKVNSRLTSVCPSVRLSICVYMSCVCWVTELSLVVASLSFYSAHGSVDPTVAVRVTLDWSQCCSPHNQNCELCHFMFFVSSIACTFRSVKWSMWLVWSCGGGGGYVLCVVCCVCCVVCCVLSRLALLSLSCLSLSFPNSLSLSPLSPWLSLIFFQLSLPLSVQEKWMTSVVWRFGKVSPGAHFRRIVPKSVTCVTKTEKAWAPQGAGAWEELRSSQHLWVRIVIMLLGWLRCVLDPARWVIRC